MTPAGPVLQGRLWVQGRASEAADLAACVRLDGTGAVLTLETGTVRRMQALTDCVGRARGEGQAAALMVDANRYSGRARRLAADAFDPDWLAAQRDLGLARVLTDSGYVADGDAAGLEDLLVRASRLPDGTVCVLPLARSWLVRGVDQAVAAVERHGVPVALVLESRDDPLDHADAVRGLLRLLGSAVPVTLLRSDMSALGALAHGAEAAAVGTGSGLRHLFPVTKPGGGGRSPRVSAVVPDLLGYYSLERIEDAHTADPDLDAWRCRCRWCGDRAVTWVASAPDPSAAAYRHSVGALAEIAREVLDPALTGSQQRLSWQQRCLHAQAHHMDINGTMGDAWEPKKALAAWVKATGSLVR